MKMSDIYKVWTDLLTDVIERHLVPINGDKIRDIKSAIYVVKSLWWSITFDLVDSFLKLIC